MKRRDEEVVKLSDLKGQKWQVGKRAKFNSPEQQARHFLKVKKEQDKQKAG